MRNRAILAICSVAAAAPLVAQPTRGAPPPLTQALPTDAKVKMGTLPNGIHYYIRQNHRPEKRAELRLVVNAGSILETEDQLGLAHFVEHTAFNGTTHFKKNDLVSYLESIGVKFGADLNAYTSFDETVYILPIPTDTARIVDKAFQILEDWAHGQVFDSTEVTNERGVVREEWRGRKGAGDRMLQQWLPIAFKGSRYAARLPIGNENSIMTATPARLRGFYSTWYRPDLMAVIAVGDFDPAQIEKLIREHFSGIPKAAANAPKRTMSDVPANKEPLVAVATDKEATSSNVELIFKLPTEQTKTVGDYRRDLTERLYLGMLNSRFDEISQKPDAPFLGAGASKESFIARNTEGFTLGAGVKDGGIPRGLEALLTEAKRVDQFGFLQTELDREKQDVLRSYERTYTEREKTNSSAFVSEYISHFLTGEVTPGIEYEYQLVQQLLPTITLAEVNTLASKWITDENRVIIALAPDKPDVKAPTAGELLAVFDAAAKAPITAYTENLSSDALVEKAPAPGGIVSGKTNAAVNVTEWTLSNGVRVLVKPTDFKADEVLLSATSPGGTSLAPDSLYMSAAYAAPIVQNGGLGKFSMIDLTKKLSGKVAGVGPSISGTSEGLRGRASPKDLETLFQLVYLEFTAPRLDMDVFQALNNQVTPYLANRGASPDEVFRDTVQVTMAQHHFRARPFTTATWSEVSPQKAFAFFKDRFADASDFTFVIVGTVDTTTLRPLVTRYLATLPSLHRQEKWRDVGITPPKGVVEKVVHKGTEPKASTIIDFTGPCVSTPENRFALRALQEVFQIKLNETLREQLGGTYSPSVGGGCGRTPRQEYSLEVDFGSSPENVETLSKSVFALIDTMKTRGPSQADVDKVKEQILRSREVDTKQNAYWLTNIGARDEAGEDLAGLGGPYDEMVKQLTVAQVQAAAKLYFNLANYARFVLLPENSPVRP